MENYTLYFIIEELHNRCNQFEILCAPRDGQNYGLVVYDKKYQRTQFEMVDTIENIIKKLEFVLTMYPMKKGAK